MKAISLENTAVFDVVGIMGGGGGGRGWQKSNALRQLYAFLHDKIIFESIV